MRGLRHLPIVLLLPAAAASAQTGVELLATNSSELEIEGPPSPVDPEVASRDPQRRLTIRAVRQLEGLVIDGRLDEPAYANSPAITDFIQQEPDEGEAATEKTEIWVFYDDQNVYVSGRNWDSQPDRIVANEMRRDNRAISQNDNFTVLLDTFYDRRNGYYFQTNPLGGLRDGLVTNERDLNTDWNTVWQVRTTRFEQGWTVEMAIPFKSLRFRKGQDQVWGIQVHRGVQRKSEDSFLTPIPRSAGFQGQFRLSDAATLVGIQTTSVSRNIELKPYAISSMTGVRNDAGTLVDNLGGDIGFDAKYGLTQGLTADFTVNTDFAQVESDEEQVNLTRFSLFFPEKREFFLEGQGIFAFGGASARGGGGGGGGGDPTPILFFSRNIGISDGLAVPIRAGARVTGRVGRYSVGLLNIQAGEDLDAAARATNFSVVRLRRDVFRRSTIGVMATHRSVGLDGLGSSQSYGVDAGFSFFQNLGIDTYYAATQAPESTGVGSSYQARIRNEGDRYGFTYQHLYVGEGFNPEIGFLRRSDFRLNRAEAKFTPRAPSIPAIRRFEYQASVNHATGASTGIVETREIQGRMQIEFENTDRFFFDINETYEFLPEDFEIADEVTLPIGGYDYTDWRATYFFGAQRRMSGRVSYGDGSFFSGDRRTVSADGRVEVSPRLSLEPRFQVNWVDLAQGSFTTNLVSSRVTYTVSPRTFIGALVQYNSSSHTMSTNARLRWEYQPGSDVLVVYSEGRDTDLLGFPRISNRGIVIKFTKLWRF